MNWLGFVCLLRNIYGPGLPDLDTIQRQDLLTVKIGQVFALRIDFLESRKMLSSCQPIPQDDSLPT